MLKALVTHPWISGVASLLVLTAAFFGGAYEACWLGKFSVKEVRTGLAACSGVEGNLRVAILRSEYTGKFFASSGKFDADAEYWHEHLRNLKIPCDLISDARLELDLKPYRVLVLPSAVCLSKKERENIRAFLKEGKGVICTWATGTRDEEGNWEGWDFLQELTDADSFKASQRNPPWLVSFSNGNPVSAGTPSGTRIQVDSPERLEATAVAVDGYWSDTLLSPIDPALPPNFLGAVIHNQYDSGRVVWFGFQENSAVAEGSSKAILDSVLTNALAWAGQRVLGAVEPWPWGYSSAVVLALDVEQDYENASYAAHAFLRSQTKGTFFCVTSLVKRDQDLVHLLQRAGELASHGNTHEDFREPWVLAQFLRLESSRWALWRLGKTWVEGFHPPEDVANPRTIQALAGAGFHYYLASGEGLNSALPVVIEVSQSLGRLHRELKLVKLARMTDDDLHFSRLGIVGLEPNWIVKRVLSDSDIVTSLGGLYVLAYHTQGLSAPEYAGVLSQLIEQWKNRATWITTTGEVAEWWAKRSQLSVSISGGHDPSALRLTVVCQGKEPTGGAVLSIYPPSGSSGAQVIPVGAGASAPKVISDPSNERLKLAFGTLEPGRTYTYELKLSH